MPVIGRLDEQVDAVLISPISKRGGQHAETEEAAPEAPSAHTRRAEESRAREESTRAELDQPRQQTDEAAEPAQAQARRHLPVWML